VENFTVARIFLFVVLGLAGCTVTTSSDDAYGSRIQMPPFWKMLPGTATEINVATNNGTGWIAIHAYPAGVPCETLLGRSGAKLGVRWVDPRPWHDKDQFVAGAAYKGGEGTAFCVLQAKEGFVVTLLAQDGFWKTHQEALLRTAESYRRKGNDKPVFDLRPLARVRPDGTLLPRTDD
jgi:hypothetical protein